MTITLTMDDARLSSIPKVKQFTQNADAVEFYGPSRREKYRWIEATLKRFRYRACRKKDRSAVKRFVMKMTGYSDVQTKRLIGQYLAGGKVLLSVKKKHRFPTLRQKGGECHAAEADAQATANPQGQAVAEAESALYLPATQQLPLNSGGSRAKEKCYTYLSPFFFMNKVYLRKIKDRDKKHFTKWWRDKELLTLTSGILKRISDQEIDTYFRDILHSNKDRHFMIAANGKTIGHISLARRRNNWHETQIVIGEKKYRGKGYGSKAIQLLLKKTGRFKISKIYLEVRPTNMGAIHAYERCGFKKAKTILHRKNKYLSKTVRMEFSRK